MTAHAREERNQVVDPGSRRPPRGLTLAVLLLIVGWGILASSVAQACNIPVFRYALERWRPDPFDAVVFHRGPLSDEQRTLIEKWRNRSIEARGVEAEFEPANFEITLVDLDSADVPKDLQLLWDRFTKSQSAEPTLPWVVFRAPGDVRKPLIVLHGALADETWTAACDSPVRRELKKRLLSGHALVWLVVPGRDAAANEQLQTLLASRLPELEKEIELPDGIGTDGVDLLSEVPLEIKFSTLTLNRDDPAEQSFVALLRAFFPKLADLDQTAVLPVFGCGRVLDAIVGDEIDADVLTDATQFLCGACSCQVKNLNPGFDLLVAGDWDSLLAVAGTPESTSIQRAKPLTPPAEPTYVPIPGKSSASPSKSAAGEKSSAGELAVASGGRDSSISTPAISASTSPPPPPEATVTLPPTYGMSRTNRDQPERWPLSITIMMVVAGTIAVVVTISRAVERRRRIRESEGATS